MLLRCRIGRTYYDNVPLFWSNLYLSTPLAEGYLKLPLTYYFPQFKMNPQNVCYWLERLFRAFVFLSCLGIVSWQCLRCLTKFLSKPQVTRLSIVNSAGNMFPSVTICPQLDPKEKTGYNSTILEECGIPLAQITNGTELYGLIKELKVVEILKHSITMSGTFGSQKT